MCYDGTNVWVAGAHHLYKIDALDMSTMADYTPDSVADGNFQFLAWDGEFIWTQLRGGTHTHKDKLWKLNPDGTVAAQIDYRTGDPIGTGVRDIKQVAMDETYLYLTAIGTVSDWVRVKRSDHSLTYRNAGDQYGGFGVAVDALSHHIYVGGGASGGEDQINLENTDSTPRTIAYNWTVAEWFDLVFDGRYVWGIASSGTGTSARQYVRKMNHDPTQAAGSDIAQAQAIDLTTALDPTTLIFSPPHLYVAGYGSVANCRIKKIFVGK
jgi:hypothetical protein